eukprot:jgi/Tetstr1/446202/TSEL_033747.t1
MRLGIILSRRWAACLALLAALSLAGGAAGVLAPISEREAVAAAVSACSLDTPLHPTLPAGRSRGDYGRGGARGEPRSNTDNALLPEACNFGKYTNPYCKTLRPVTPSAKGCHLVDLSDPSWYTGPPRELVLYGDSITLQMERAIRCLLARHAPVPEGGTAAAAAGGPGGPAGRRGALETLDETPTAIQLALFAGRRRLASQTKEPGPARYSPALRGAPCRKDSCTTWGSLTVCAMRTNEHPLQRDTAPCLLAGAPNDVHVFNVGMWHNSKGAMGHAVGAFAAFVRRARMAGEQLPHLVWRESTPQHFAAPGGNYPGRRGGACLKTAAAKQMEGREFRNAATWAALGDLDLHIAFAWELLKLHPELHVQKFKGTETDCSHWCETPTGAVSALAHVLLSDVFRTYWAGNSTRAPR